MGAPATPTAAGKYASNRDIKKGQLFIFLGGKPVAFATNAFLKNLSAFQPKAF